jgi:uncharacterized protein (TIGR02594 family)
MDRYKVVAFSLHLRKEPNIMGEIIGYLFKDDIVQLVSISGDRYWYRVITEGGDRGWASHKYLVKVEKDSHNEAPPWLTIAFQEVGEKEFPGNMENPRIQAYLHSTNLGVPYSLRDETPWCSAFVNWCVERAGYEGTDSAWARSWLYWGQSTETPRKGTIVVFRRDVNKGHVGFYLDESLRKIEILGGNQSNCVNISKYYKSDLLGYRDMV